MVMGLFCSENSEKLYWEWGGFLHQSKISALILAAGMSRRMGDFKPLLPLRGKTLIENSVESVLNGGAEDAVIVTGFRADEVETVLGRSFAGRVSFVRNDDYEVTDMMRSVKIGTASLPACDAFFLLPGDMPVVSHGTFEKLLSARTQSGSPLIFPALNGFRKHPPLIDSSLIPAVLRYDGENGLRGLWKEYEKDILTVPVDDAGVWIDIDTPDDYRDCRKIYENTKEV